MYLRYSAIYTTVNIFHFICSVNDEAKTKDAILYATFSTPPNSIGGSAVCAFRLREVSDAFSGGFKVRIQTCWLVFATLVLLLFQIMYLILYLKNKVGVVDFANAQGVVMYKAQGPEGPACFEILPLCGLL